MDIQGLHPHSLLSVSAENRHPVIVNLVIVARSDSLIALGGGVVGDITGYAAATYLRGMSFIQIPTTLLAQIDSSVGGKTAIDLPAGKNLVGAFKQPELVICDPLTLKTLSPEIVSDGMAEAIKYGMIRSRELFDIIASHTINDYFDDIDDIIYRCVSIKRTSRPGRHRRGEQPGDLRLERAVGSASGRGP